MDSLQPIGKQKKKACFNPFPILTIRSDFGAVNCSDCLGEAGNVYHPDRDTIKQSFTLPSGLLLQFTIVYPFSTAPVEVEVEGLVTNEIHPVPVDRLWIILFCSYLLNPSFLTLLGVIFSPSDAFSCTGVSLLVNSSAPQDIAIAC